MKHQIIYTSCMRGIDGVNDGQQVYSYSRNFMDSKTDEVKGLLSFRIPKLSDNQEVTEETVALLPDNYTYRQLSNGRSAIALNTYLGRDYMGSNGRFGNHLSHALIFDKEELTKYPIEYFGSSELRRTMSFEEVNSSERPEYLPSPELIVGNKVNFESTVAFLDQGNRMTLFKSMLHSLFLFPTTKKRILICDEPDNILFWVAGIQFALPLELAKNINFTTYEYDPDLSYSQVCGVLPSGTIYDVDRCKASENHYLYDFVNDVFEPLTDSHELLEFIDASISFSPDSLFQFHKFITENFTYRMVDESIYNAYTLFEITKNGLSSVSLEKFSIAIAFEKEYHALGRPRSLVHALLKYSNFISTADDSYAIEIIRVLFESNTLLKEEEQNDLIKQASQIVLKKFTACSDVEEFRLIYQTISDFRSPLMFNLVSELIKDENKTLLNNLVRQSLPLWKQEMMVSGINSYILDSRLQADCLDKDQPVGRIYYDIVKFSYLRSESEGLSVASQIIRLSGLNWEISTGLVLNFVEYIAEFCTNINHINKLWSIFEENIIELHFDRIKDTFYILVLKQKMSRIFELYTLGLNKKTNPSDKELFYKEFCSYDFVKKEAFQLSVFPNYMSEYFYNLRDLKLRNSRMDVQPIFVRLFDQVIDTSLDQGFINELVMQLIENLSLISQNKDHLALVSKISDYEKRSKSTITTPKFAVFQFIQYLKKTPADKNDLNKFMSYCNETKLKSLDISSLNLKDFEDYQSWLIQYLTVSMKDINFVIKVFQYHRMTDSQSNRFIKELYDVFVEKYLRMKKPELILEVVIFISECGDNSDKHNAGVSISKLGKKGLADLDQLAKSKFLNKKDVLKDWQFIYDNALSGTNLFNKIGNVFNRK